MKKLIFLFVVAISFAACKEETKIEPEKPLKTYTITWQNQLNSNAKLMIDLIGGVVYTAADAKSHQKDIDFVYWQYTGTATNHDTYLKSPLQIDSDASGAGQTFSQSVGIDTWTTLNDPIASATDVTEAAFDALTTNADVIALHTQNTHTMVNYTTITDVYGDLQGKVFIFQDKNGRKGFFRIKAITLDTGGAMDIDVKIVQ